MKVLVACEYSGRVRDAFRDLGHDAMSCDLLPTEVDGPHYQGDVRDVLGDGWDLLIAHPECTRATLAGVRWMYHPDDTALPTHERRRHPDYPQRMLDLVRDAELFLTLKGCDIPRKCIENSQPHRVAMELFGKYTQKIQPWQFGDPYTKGACLWLDGLPNLVATHDKPSVVTPACHHASPGPNRWKDRSRTYPAIARAMAEQWGSL